MAELSAKEANFAPELAKIMGFESFDEATKVLSFKRGGASVDDKQTYTSLFNALNKRNAAEANTSVSQKLATQEMWVAERKLRDVSDGQRTLLSDMLEAVTVTPMPTDDPDLVEDTQLWITDVKKARRRGSNVHDASKLITRGYAILDDLGVEFERTDTDETPVSDDEHTLGATLSDGTTVDTDPADSDNDEF